MGFLTTHVLDTANGCPANGVAIQCYRLPERLLLADVVTNADGRVDAPILNEQDFKQGRYELVFHTQRYFSSKGSQLSEPAFLDDVVIRFGIANAEDH